MDFRLFLPHPIENGAFVEFYGSYERDRTTSEQSQVKWEDLFLKERLTLFSNGFVYHPRFLVYLLEVSGGLKQESYEASFIGSPLHRHGSSLEYSGRVILLPEHPYNLELFALRYEPLTREDYAAPIDAVTTSRGAELRYAKKPWFFHARYSDEHDRLSDHDADVKTWNVGLGIDEQFSKGQLDANANYTPSRFQTSTGSEGRTTSAVFEDFLDLGRWHESTNVSWNALTQNGGGVTDTDTKQLLVLEQIRAELGSHLLANVSWRYQDAHADQTSSDGIVRSIATIRNDYQAGLQHQLYESLRSNYTLRYTDDRSSSGNSSSLAHFLGLSYAKLITNGRILAGLYGSTDDIKSRGQTVAIDEPHAGVSIPGTFTLDRTGADPGTLVVFAKSPQPPFELVELTENVHYGVAVVGNQVQVTLLSLPVEFTVPGSYDVRVTYSLVGGEFELRTTTFGNNGSVALFKGFVTPYYSYNIVRSSVLSGAAPAGGLDSRTITVGVAVLKEPLRAKVEYFDVFWDNGPYHGWKGDLSATKNVTPTTTAGGTLLYQWRRFSETASQRGYLETLASASVSVQQFLFSRSVSIGVGGGYTRVTGLDEGHTLLLNGSLTWRIGLIDVSAGANYYNTDSQNGTAFASHRERGFYFLKLKRRIF